MIAYVKGTVEDITEENVVLDVHDIGYNIKISAGTAGRLLIPVSERMPFCCTGF